LIQASLVLPSASQRIASSSSHARKSATLGRSKVAGRPTIVGEERLGEDKIRKRRHLLPITQGVPHQHTASQRHATAGNRCYN